MLREPADTTERPARPRVSRLRPLDRQQGEPASDERRALTDYGAFLTALKPVSTYAGHHFTRIWFKTRPTTPEQLFLRKHCQKFRIHKPGDVFLDAHGNVVKRSKDSQREDEDGEPLFKKGDPYLIHINFQHRYEWHVIGPDEDARAFLADYDDRVPNKRSGKLPAKDKRRPKIIYDELALEHILRSEMEKARTFDAVAHCHVETGSLGRNRMVWIFGSDFFSSGRRWPGSFFTAYTVEVSYIAGELDCLRSELRKCSAREIRAAGIQTLKDWANFDFRKLFAKDLKFYSIDLERLGRYHRNRGSGAPRQRATPNDIRTARVLWRAYGHDENGNGTMSVQSFVANYEAAMRKRGASRLLRPYLNPIPVDHLLP